MAFKDIHNGFYRTHNKCSSVSSVHLSLVSVYMPSSPSPEHQNDKTTLTFILIKWVDATDE